jgi:type VI protein secretion system component VasK
LAWRSSRVALNVSVGPLLVTACGVALFAVVVAAVHHAEVVAHRVGEPFGTLVLALAVTAIGSSLIVSVCSRAARQGSARARYDVRNGHDHRQRRRRRLRAARRAASSRAGVRIEGAGPSLAALPRSRRSCW